MGEILGRNVIIIKKKCMYIFFLKRNYYITLCMENARSGVKPLTEHNIEQKQKII